MKTIERVCCISCGSNLTTLKSIERFPIYMGVTDEEAHKDIFADLTFAKCSRCNCVQLKNLIPLDILYKEAHTNSVGKTWLHHHASFAEFINKRAQGNVIEVGGAHLHLAKNLEKNDNIKSITVYDSNLFCYGNKETEKIKLREEFFNKENVSVKPDAVIHSHVIEHLYDPFKELKDMSDLIDDGSFMFISSPIIDEMMKDGFTNAMNFEHSYGVTKNLLHKMLRHCNLRIVEQSDFNKYCVFICAVKDSKDLQEDYNPVENESYYHKFINYHDTELKRIKSSLEKEEKAFIFGAHIFTQFLLKYGLDENKFVCVLDNDERKIGKRLYGTNLKVCSPKVLKNYESPIVLLKAAQYTNEIKCDIIENINSDTRFIL